MFNNKLKHDITDEFGYWYNGSILKNILTKNVYINKDNITDLITHYKKQILPHKPLMVEIYEPIVTSLIDLKNKLGW